MKIECRKYRSIGNTQNLKTPIGGVGTESAESAESIPIVSAVSVVSVGRSGIGE